jgi:membrane-associated protein
VGLHAESLIATYGLAGLGLCIFAETGLLIGLFLPGETLLVLAGAYSHSGTHGPHFFLPVVMAVAGAAAIIGGLCGFVIGWRAGPALFHRPNSRFFRPQYAQRTHEYFARYGSRTVVLARFIPFVRTLANPAAGIGRMPVHTFTAYNVAGGLLWAVVVPLIGFGLAHVIPVKNNVLAITVTVGTLSCIPLAVEFFRARRRAVASA